MYNIFITRKDVPRMTNYPFDPQLLAELTELYHDFLKSATQIIKSSNLDFSKVRIQSGKSYDCDSFAIDGTKCLSACLYYKNFLLTSATVGVEPWN